MTDIPRIPFRSDVPEASRLGDLGPRTGVLVSAAFVLGAAVGATTAVLLTHEKRQAARTVDGLRTTPRAKVVERRSDSLTAVVKGEAGRVLRTLGDQLVESIAGQVRTAFGPSGATRGRQDDEVR